MITVKRNVGEHILQASAEGYMKDQVEALLDIILRVKKNELVENVKIQVGCTIYRLKKNDESFVVVAPDYSKNPMSDSTEDLTIPLWIQLEQGILLNTLKLDGELVNFYDKIVCSRGALDLDEIYLERVSECEKGDSGWFIGSVGEDDSNEEFEAFYVYQIVGVRPSIMQVLSLPSGYMAIFKKDELVAVIDDNDIDILAKD